jgi:hypothetical protein
VKPVRSTVPSEGAVPDPGEGWGLRRAARLEYQGTSDFLGDQVYVAELSLYLEDMLRPHGMALDGDALVTDGQSHEQMALALIERVLPEGEQVDLLVLTHVTFDVMPARSSSVHLSHLCSGGPMTFAITDQGAVAPFTALRLIRQYAGTGEARRALLIVLEQAWLPYDPGTAVVLPTGHAGVALLFGDGDAQSIEGGTIPNRPARLGPIAMRPQTKPPGLPTVIQEFTSQPPVESTAILGPLLADQCADAADLAVLSGLRDIRSGPAARPYAGLWWELAGELSRPGAEPRRLVAADYDPGSLTLCAAAIDVDDPVALESAVPVGQRNGRQTA